MRKMNSAVVLTAIVAFAGCSQEVAPPSADLSFLNDLQTELAMEQASAQKAVSEVELGQTSLVEEAPAAPVAAAPRAAAAPRRSTASATRSSSSGSASAGTVARQPRVVEVKHTKRDAAIGAVAGAAVGAVAAGSENRVKGAVIGAVLGGVAGGVIGNNVDKSTRIEY